MNTVYQKYCDSSFPMFYFSSFYVFLLDLLVFFIFTLCYFVIVMRSNTFYDILYAPYIRSPGE